MSPGVDAVLLDLDDTICEYRRPGADILAHAFETVGVEPLFTVREYVARYEDLVDDSVPMETLRERCFADLAAERGHDPALGRELARVYAAERDHANVRFRTGAREALETLAERYPLGLVTNGHPEMQATKLDSLGIRDAFETVVHGGYDAPAKPDPDPFHLALETLGSRPAQTVHVGNSLESDVTGARAAGLQAAWLDVDGVDPDPEPSYVLDSMGDLLDPPWA